MNYLKLLEHSYSVAKERSGDGDVDRLEFLAEGIFEFYTYENIVQANMAKAALGVCQAISSRQTFAFITDEDRNFWYLIMVHMPFFAPRISWGSSIRGAWWDIHASKTLSIESTALFEGDEQLLNISFNEKQWHEFIEAMISFAAAELGDIEP